MAGQRDAVDRITGQWNEVRPDLDVSPIEVIGRISRLSRLIDRRLGENFAANGIENWMYDVLATLYRIGPPHELTPGDLVDQTMVTTGAITNRIDRLKQRGLVARRQSPEDRRSVIVSLTDDGRRLVEEVAGSHLDVERELLASLSTNQRDSLARTLRKLAVGLGDLDHPR